MPTYVKPAVSFLNIKLMERVTLDLIWVGFGLTTPKPNSCYYTTESGYLPDFVNPEEADM